MPRYCGIGPNRSGVERLEAALLPPRLASAVREGRNRKDRARQWLSFPQYGLGGVVPLDYARTEVGAREVETLLGRIEYGVYS